MHHFVGSRDVDDHLGTGRGKERGRRDWSPEILADFYPESRLPDSEEQVRGYVALLGTELHDRIETVAVVILAVIDEPSAGRVGSGKEIRAGSEPAALVELCVGREVYFRDYAFDAAVADDHGAVVEPPPETDRSTDHDGTVPAPGVVGYHPDGLLGLGKQEVLAEKVEAGVAGDRKLREHGKGDPGGLGLVYHAAYSFTVVLHVGDLDPRYAGGHPEQSKSLHGKAKHLQDRRFHRQDASAPPPV